MFFVFAILIYVSGALPSQVSKSDITTIFPYSFSFSFIAVRMALGISEGVCFASIPSITVSASFALRDFASNTGMLSAAVIVFSWPRRSIAIDFASLMRSGADMLADESIMIITF
ncbi:hypothetical protein DSECCO2_537170 [anaerobic digester metagenome]